MEGSLSAKNVILERIFGFSRVGAGKKAVLRSQNYLISAPAPAPLFPLFWLRLQLRLPLQLQPYIAT